MARTLEEPLLQIKLVYKLYCFKQGASVQTLLSLHRMPTFYKERDQ